MTTAIIVITCEKSLRRVSGTSQDDDAKHGDA